MIKNKIMHYSTTTACIIFVLVSVIANIVMIRQNAHAALASDEEIMTKILAYGLAKNCAKAFVGEIDAYVFNTNDNDWVETLLGNNINNDSLGTYGTGVPMGIGNTLTDSVINCGELLKGYSGSWGNVTGLISRGGVSLPSSFDASQDFLTSIGYEPVYSSDEAKEGCLYADYRTEGNMHNETPKICFKLDKDNNVLSESLDYRNASSEGTNNDSAPMSFYLLQQGNDCTFAVTVRKGGDEYSSPDYTNSFSCGPNDKVSWDTVKTAFNNIQMTASYAPNGLGWYEVNSMKSEIKDTPNNTGKATKYVFSNDANKVLQGFTKNEFETVENTYFSERQRYGLYMKYLTRSEIFNVRIDSSEENCGASLSDISAEYAVMVNVDGEKKWCGITKTSLEKAGQDKSGNRTKYVTSSFKVMGFEGLSSALTKEIDVYELVEYLKNIDYSKISVEDLYKPDPETGRDNTDMPTRPGDASGENVIGDFCLASNSGAMGWGLCPAITGLRGTLGSIYGGVIVPILKIDPSFLENSTDSLTYKGWEIFRNIANIAFVILILVVIFSQVTGIGIDNYGIKRILPKLIITAILVNFSFIICQLAIDVSNILGAGLKALFDGLAAQNYAAVTIGEESVTISAGTSAFVSSMNGLFSFMKAGAVVFGGIALFTSPGSVAMAILFALLSVAVAVLFMFASLGARVVGVIVLSVISPLAFVAYALPNTNVLFRKWWNVFKALLLLYPICGLLVGAGQFAGTIIFSSASNLGGNPTLQFFYIMMALFTSVLPFFALPTLLKRTMSAMGQLGASITNAGARARGAVRRARKSDAVKRREINWNAADTKNNFRANTIGKYGTKGMKKRLAANFAAKDKMDRDDHLGGKLLQDKYDDRSAGEIAAGLSLDMSEQDLAIALDRLSGMDMKQATDWVAAQAGKLDIVNNAADYQKLLRLGAAVKKSDKLHSALSKEEDVKRMLDGKGFLSDGTKANLRGHSRAFASSANTNDIVGLSSKAQRRAFETGAVDSSVQNELMNSRDTSIRSALDGDPGKSHNIDALRAGASAEMFSEANAEARDKLVADYRAAHPYVDPDTALAREIAKEINTLNVRGNNSGELSPEATEQIIEWNSGNNNG
ncbi:hypothetical protein IKF76_01355 [Candidatus Saccharibacteria bacterium]|nr:hypothetical protein [Candidatus Saccharibacteria bacterium]